MSFLHRLLGRRDRAQPAEEEPGRSAAVPPPTSTMSRLTVEVETPAERDIERDPAGPRMPEWRTSTSAADWVAIDIETTGLSPRTDRIVEVAIARFDPSGRELDAWATLIQPMRDMGATRIHGITAGDVRTAPTFPRAAPEILARLSGARLAAHNARFDLGFLQIEFERAGIAWGNAEAFCTMTVPHELGVVVNRRLAACCAELGIPMAHEHTALGDARATASILFRTMERVRRLPDLPAIAPQWDPPAVRVAPCLREQAPAQVESALGSLADRIGLPDNLEVSPSVGISYLALLDRVLEDRRLTEEEIHSLTEAARDWGISASVAADLHRAYLAGIGELALADGVITPAERADLKRITELLGVGPTAPGRVLQVRPAKREESFAGLSVCFTGQSACTIDGVQISRAQQESLAGQAGMIVKANVSRALDLLVLADPDSTSGKAMKAAELEVRKIAEPVFWRALGVAID